MKSIYKISVTIILLIFSAKYVSGQDPQFSQFYAAPMYLCPSFAGSTNGSRVAVNYRNQWTRIPGAFVSYIFSLDHYFASKKSGVGLLFLRDYAGIGKLGSTNIGLQYSYNIKINRNWQVRPGMHFLYSSRSVDFSQHTFLDQLSPEGDIAPISAEIPTLIEKNGYLDFSVSGLAYAEKHWFGITIDHLMKPNQSLIRENESKIPIKYSFFGGTKVGLNGRLGRKNEESISFAAIYSMQEKYDQLVLGAYWLKSSLIIGIMYRGLPVFKSYETGYNNNDAAILLLGCKFQDFAIAYSYDFTISRLVTSTGGSHEFSVIYLFNQNLKYKKKMRVISCPKVTL